MQPRSRHGLQWSALLVTLLTSLFSFSSSPASYDASSDPATLWPQAVRSAKLLPDGYLHTSANQIVDVSGHPVRLACIGYFSPGHVAGDLAGMRGAGFNCLRYPWYDQTLPTQFAVMDQIVAYAGRFGLKVIFDHHGNETPAAANSFLPYPCNGLPIDQGPGTDGTDGCGDHGSVDLARFIADWVSVAARYKDNPTVIGVDLTNEPHFAPLTWRHGGGATWGDDGPTDLKHMYELAGDAILRVNPGVLIICEGIGRFKGALFDGTPLLTSGAVDLSFVRTQPVTLHEAQHVVYSVHDYPATIGKVVPDFGPVKVAAMTAAWGYLVKGGLAPVWVGEMGASLDGLGPDSAGPRLAHEQAWAKTLVDYVNGNLASAGGLAFSAGEEAVGTTWWAWGALDGQSPDGTLDKQRNLRQAQWQVYARLRPQLERATSGSAISSGTVGGP